jgi:hypothetical protein
VIILFSITYLHKMSIEQELWRIFTFYSLHYDANYPETWKVTPFIRFAKDCQITSSKFMVSELELEIVRLVRNKRKFMKVSGVNGKDFDGAHTIVITFPDFLRLLEIIAVRVYPGLANGKSDHIDPSVCLRRLLLENVLLLANRRSDTISDICFANTDDTAKACVRETFGKSLMGIFKYYIDLADKRRSQELATESVKSGVSGIGNAQQNEYEVKSSKRVRDALRAQKDLISFREYCQFCSDFSLKSTTLLTAIEVGDIFLNVVPYDKDTKTIKGMAFGQFCDAIVAMAMLAYRDADVKSTNKVKALLHFMWRGVNQSDKRNKAANSKTQTSGQHAGSLNHYGSGPFCDNFLKHWIAEGFPNYSTPPTEAPPTGSQVLQRIMTEGFEDAGNKDDEGSEEDAPVESATEAAAPKEWHIDDTRPPVVMHAFLLAALFRTRPELAEMVYLKLKDVQTDQEINL